MHLSLSCLLQGETRLAFYSALMATETMMQKGGGLSPFSATCVTMYGIVEIGLGNIHLGVRLGELAMKLNSRIQSNDTMCRMVSLNVPVLLHWKCQIHELKPVITNAMKCGLDSGDIVYGSRCVASFFAFRVMLGENLESMEDCIRTMYHRLCEQGQTDMMRFAQPVMQYVLNMRSTPTTGVDLTMLSGDIMDESEYMRIALEMNHRIMLLQAWTYKSRLAYHIGNYEMAATIYETMEHTATARPTRYTFAAAPHHFYGALIFFERYRSTRRLKHLWTARKHVKRLKWMASFDYPNVTSFLTWLKAEELTLKSRDVVAVVAAYTKVIERMHNERSIQREALANERLSKVLSLLGWHALSVQYLDKSLQLYRDCGATAKYDWLMGERNLRPEPTRMKVITPIDEIHIVGVSGIVPGV
jgi:tetratricopeptide (TPR) repeat protein